MPFSMSAIVSHHAMRENLAGIMLRHLEIFQAFIRISFTWFWHAAALPLILPFSYTGSLNSFCGLHRCHPRLSSTASVVDTYHRKILTDYLRLAKYQYFKELDFVNFCQVFCINVCYFKILSLYLKSKS